MINKDAAFNIIVVLLTFIGFAIGFINEQYRVLAWTISFAVIITIILFVIFNEYIDKIDSNEKAILQLKKDLNMQNRLSILETKIEEYNKRKI